jgi:hypothetical protein
MGTTINGAQPPKTSSINQPDTTGAVKADATVPQAQPADTKVDARQAEASKQYAKDVKPQNDAQAGYMQQKLDKAYKSSTTQNTTAAKTSSVDAKQADSAKAPQTYDISNVTPEQIKELRNKKQDQLANTIENAKIAYDDFVKANPGVKVMVTTSEGNGGKPVLVVKGAKADKDAHVHTHYHGDNATVADPLGSKAGQNARIRDTLMKDPHAVFVLPEAANSTPKTDSTMNDNSYSASWSNVKSQVKTTNDALDAAGVQRPPKESVVSFHSGGGMALVNLVNNNKDKGNATLQADRLELFDCVYHFGKENHPAYHFEQRLREWSQTDSGKSVKQVIFYRGSNDVSRAGVMEKSVGTDKFKVIDMAKQPPLDDTINPPAENANGNWMEVVRNGKQTGKLAHNFNPDPHYRTVGQFLGTRPAP